MDFALVDPRDTEWEQLHPVYRVYFWVQVQLSLGAGPERAGWGSEEWRLTGALDVQEVMAWATGPAGRGRQFELFVEAEGASKRGLVRIAGGDPTSA